MRHNAFTKKFALTGPLMVAPMGGGPTTPQLVAAVSAAGALGSLAGAYLDPDTLRADIGKVRSLTDRPFVVNLFTPMPAITLDQAEIDSAIAATRPTRQALQLTDPARVEPPFHQDVAAQLEVVLSEKPAALSFIFGLLPASTMRACADAGIFTIGTATTVQEGLALESAGVDAVIAQGVDAGAHRATFDPMGEDPLIGTMSLTRLLVRSLRIPVIATGGIMDGAGIAAAIELGAVAAQLGTAFLLCDEAGTSPAYRRGLVAARGSPTRLTRAFSGRLARGIENRFVREMAAAHVLPFPAQNAFTRDIRAKAAQLGEIDYLSLWAGAGVGMLRPMPAGELVSALFDELTQRQRG